ncbi:hypothetical protein K1719_010145 [Acacia pycnantha]|nr:hypothetical protein K1719_010145 [Acacia pycnantha]
MLIKLASCSSGCLICIAYLDLTSNVAMSASLTAATRAYDWESYWGEDVFPKMANASAGLSFVAFVAFPLTSLVSGYILCKFR